jgi:hypothetical protein
MEEERSVRHRCGGGRYGVEVDVDKERASMSVWRGNEL